MKIFTGNYMGIVVQNNDPDRTGRIKIFVPHITATIYKKWVQEKSNKRFKFLGSNIGSVLTQSLSGNMNQIDHINNIIDENKLNP